MYKMPVKKRVTSVMAPSVAMSAPDRYARIAPRHAAPLHPREGKLNAG